MYDWIVVAFVVVWIFFMVKRGGCCGGHRNEGKHSNSTKGSCCHGNEEKLDKK